MNHKSLNSMQNDFKTQLDKFQDLEREQKLEALSKAESKTLNDIFHDKLDPNSLEYKMGLCRN